MTNTEQALKALKVGDPVWMLEYSSWGRGRYTKGIVKNITNSGMIDVMWGAISGPPYVGELTERFNPDGRERGSGYHGRRLDTKPFHAREAEMQKQHRVDVAVAALRNININNHSGHDAESLRLELDRLQALLDEVRARVAAIDAPVEAVSK